MQSLKCIKLYHQNSCYYSVQTLLSSQLLSKNLKIKIYKTIIFPVMLYVCETWSLTLREECKLRVFDNRILRRKFKGCEWGMDNPTKLKGMRF